MPSQDTQAECKPVTENNSQVELDLFEAITKKDPDRVLEIIRSEPNLNLNCVDKDELSPLQHACHIGDVELARSLINNGADVSFTKRKDGYTPLMFAAISAKHDIVRLLLERGVDTTAENCVNRTAAQMAAFVGQSKIVSIISSWIPYDSSVEPYTRRRELEDQPRIPTRSLGHLLHEFIVYPSFHPIKLILFIKENLSMVEHGSQLLYVLDDLCSKSIKPPSNDETLSLKYHYLSYLLQNCLNFVKSKVAEGSGGGDDQRETKFDAQLCNKTLEVYIRKLIKRNNPKDIQPVTPQLDRFITECLYKFPYTQLAIYKTTTFALSKGESSELSAYSVLIHSLNGPRMFGHASEACSICLELNKSKKCSKCKAVYYCGPMCQTADWFQHKKVCKSPEEVPLLGPDNEPSD